MVDFPYINDPCGEISISLSQEDARAFATNADLMKDFGGRLVTKAVDYVIENPDLFPPEEPLLMTLIVHRDSPNAKKAEAA